MAARCVLGLVCAFALLATLVGWSQPAQAQSSAEYRIEPQVTGSADFDSVVDIRIVAREVVATDRAVQLVLTSTDAPVDLNADGYDAGGQKTVAIEANRPGVVETVQILEAAPGVSAASFALQVFDSCR